MKERVRFDLDEPDQHLEGGQDQGDNHRGKQAPQYRHRRILSCLIRRAASATGGAAPPPCTYSLTPKQPPDKQA